MKLLYRDLKDEDLLQVFERGIEKERLSVYLISELDPKELLVSLGIDVAKFSKNLPEDKILDQLYEYDGFEWKYLLQDPIAPVIVVGGKLIDGKRRCLLAYVLDEKIKALIFR